MVDKGGVKLERCHANSLCIRAILNGALTAGSGARPDTDVQAHRTSHLLLQLLDARQSAYAKQASEPVYMTSMMQARYISDLNDFVLFSCLEGVTFLVLGATGSLFSLRSSQSKSSAFLSRLGLQVHMQAD